MKVTVKLLQKQSSDWAALGICEWKIILLVKCESCVEGSVHL